jgi:Fur family transcriptional regulator, peroxide stress response regulator
MKADLNVNAQAVLNAVRSARNHPTALEVYEAVKQQRPHIGLASVYRILHGLVEKEYIREVALGDESSRYDGQISRHDHALCRSCSKILDVPVAVALSSRALEEAARVVGMKLESHEVRLYGLCEACRAAASDTITECSAHVPQQENIPCRQDRSQRSPHQGPSVMNRQPKSR